MRRGTAPASVQGTALPRPISHCRRAREAAAALPSHRWGGLRCRVPGASGAATRAPARRHRLRHGAEPAQFLADRRRPDPAGGGLRAVVRLRLLDDLAVPPDQRGGPAGLRPARRRVRATPTVPRGARAGRPGQPAAPLSPELRHAPGHPGGPGAGQLRDLPPPAWRSSAGWSWRAGPARWPSISPALGRSCSRGSPSTVTGPSARAATGGRNRSTVPASPASTVTGPLSVPGATSQSLPSTSSMPTQSAPRPAAMRSVSRALRGCTSRLGPSASAASTSARAVSDFDPGRDTTASTGAGWCGAGQTSLTRSVCPPAPHLPARAQPACGFSVFLTGTVRSSRRLANSNMASSESSRP